jgi:hypothetical protein
VLPTIVPGAVPSLVPMAGSTPPPPVPPLKQNRRHDFTDADSGSAATLLAGTERDPAYNERPAAFLAGAKSLAKATGPNWSVALLGALAAVGVVVAVQMWPEGSSASAHTGAAPAASSGTSPEHQAAALPVTVPTSVKPAAPVDLKVQVTGKASWVGVKNGAGAQLFWNIMQPGESREFTDATKLELIVGNASSVNLTVNGKDVGAPGHSGQVVHTVYSASS